ncbi:hypothetical protein A3F03_04030 [Candidatus Roizmanbacteria bacterium RIFCSPHIGHO2_12_FULL_41_11]|uniref:Peptidase S9 prolyl oligopeptidase catalytic domain-containing protein n=1 Tax=Candidatus Roizmanbacteria bacterium RIFCSPHIGHO2_12_FULL_41_11 TaxID=1802052 RepID=A0A1F7I665_9BACT|nr:MAG: hypothetical protein A3F03_04030 [Candidatus Roizmanbacteria bacterium RIFCSPHIGHO2_12_FULL_41_11]
MKIFIAITVTFIITSSFFLFLFYWQQSYLSPIGKTKSNVSEKPLEKYAYLRLQKTKFSPSAISIGELLSDNEDFQSYLFYYQADGKKISGLLNIPKGSGHYPVLILIRGYVDRDNYQTGVGTNRVGEVFARAGFITLAPDFLGYGQSDAPSSYPLEERFQTYTSALTLLSSLKNLPTVVGKVSPRVIPDPSRVGIWGHSNGGQIALSVLEISGQDYPTVLWAPVSKPFPYSILYYTDEADDHGRALRRLVGEFEKNYDVESYSLTNYLDWIKAPIQLHQGLSDGAVPAAWSKQLSLDLKSKNKEVEYFTYTNADHNLMPDGWTAAVERSSEFFRSNIFPLF